jgi:hypothetical protein
MTSGIEARRDDGQRVRGCSATPKPPLLEPPPRCEASPGACLQRPRQAFVVAAVEILCFA